MIDTHHIARATKKEDTMSSYLQFIPGILLLAAPVFTQEDLRTIGQIEAKFDGETLSQSTVSYLAEGKREGTASLTTLSGYTSLSIFSVEGRPISIEAMYTSTATLDPTSRLMSITISYFPNGLTSYWTSEDSPEPARITFDQLDTGTDTPLANGAFEALLCVVTEMGEGADLDCPSAKIA